MAARGARAAAGDAGDRVSLDARRRRPNAHLRAAFRAAAAANRLCRGPEHRDRVPLGAKAISSDCRRWRPNLVAPRWTFISHDGHRRRCAAKAATATIPIVFVAVGDPVGARFRREPRAAGRQLTGIYVRRDELGAKRLELLHELVPGLTRLAVLCAMPASAGRSWHELPAAQPLRLRASCAEARKPARRDRWPRFERWRRRGRANAL